MTDSESNRFLENDFLIIKLKEWRIKYFNMAYNQAIEDAIYKLDKIGHSTDRDIVEIRKLKK